MVMEMPGNNSQRKMATKPWVTRCLVSQVLSKFQESDVSNWSRFDCCPQIYNKQQSVNWF